MPRALVVRDPAGLTPAGLGPAVEDPAVEDPGAFQPVVARPRTSSETLPAHRALAQAFSPYREVADQEFSPYREVAGRALDQEFSLSLEVVDRTTSGSAAANWQTIAPTGFKIANSSSRDDKIVAIKSATNSETTILVSTSGGTIPTGRAGESTDPIAGPRLAR